MTVNVNLQVCTSLYVTPLRYVNDTYIYLYWLNTQVQKVLFRRNTTKFTSLRF